MEFKIDIAKHLLNILEIKTLNFHKIKCNDEVYLLIYEPFAKIIFKETFEKNTLSEIFSIISNKKTSETISGYLHSGIINVGTLDLSELLEILHFSFEIKKLNKLKALVGVEIENRLKSLNVLKLADAIKEMQKKGFIEARKWLSSIFLKLGPSESQMKEISFPSELLMAIMTSLVDKHLQDLFSAELTNDKTGIDVNIAKDEHGTVFDVLKILWEKRNESGDFTVKSEIDNKVEKYHQAVLTILPFFMTQTTTLLSKSNKEHATFLSSDSFESFIKMIYLNSKTHFDSTHAIELLDKKTGIEFYLTENNEQLVAELSKKLDKKNYDEKNSLKIMLLSIKNKQEEMLQNAIEVLIGKPNTIDTINSFNKEDKFLLFSQILKVLLQENKEYKHLSKPIFSDTITVIDFEKVKEILRSYSFDDDYKFASNGLYSGAPENLKNIDSGVGYANASSNPSWMSFTFVQPINICGILIGENSKVSAGWNMGYLNNVQVYFDGKHVQTINKYENGKSIFLSIEGTVKEIKLQHTNYFAIGFFKVLQKPFSSFVEKLTLENAKLKQRIEDLELSNLTHILNKQQLQQLENWFYKGKKITLLYRASRDGCSAASFHGICDNKGSILVVIKSDNGNIFGAFTVQPFASNGAWCRDDQACLYSLQGPCGVNQFKLVANHANSIYRNFYIII